MILRHATLSDGTSADVRVEGPLITAVAPSLAAAAGEEMIELDGYVLLPAPAEPPQGALPHLPEGMR